MIYSYHMALFVMLAGRFAKPGGAPATALRRGWRRLILPLARFGLLGLVLMNWFPGAHGGCPTRAGGAVSHSRVGDL